MAVGCLSQALLAARNQLVDLPPELGKLSGLTQLDLASNQLTSRE